jgi:hypothetical protein
MLAARIHPCHTNVLSIWISKRGCVKTVVSFRFAKVTLPAFQKIGSGAPRVKSKKLKHGFRKTKKMIVSKMLFFRGISAGEIDHLTFGRQLECVQLVKFEQKRR